MRTKFSLEVGVKSPSQKKKSWNSNHSLGEQLLMCIIYLFIYLFLLDGIVKSELHSKEIKFHKLTRSSKNFCKFGLYNDNLNCAFFF